MRSSREKIEKVCSVTVTSFIQFWSSNNFPSVRCVIAMFFLNFFIILDSLAKKKKNNNSLGEQNISNNNNSVTNTRTHDSRKNNVGI